MDVSSVTLPLPDGPGVPEWIHLLPPGKFSNTSGITYHLHDPQAVVQATKARGKIALDENHSTQRATPAGQPSPARAWISEFKVDANGLWGKPEWNPSGVALMTDKSYRHISPVFKFDKTPNRNVEYLISAALTNDPGLTQLTALHSNNGNNMDKVAICTALGLAQDADDAAVLTALQTASGSAIALQTAQAEVAALKGQIATLKATMVEPEKLIALQTRLDTLEVTQKREKATAYVDAAIKAGKPIAATRDQMIALHTNDPAGTERLITGLPSINERVTGARTALQSADGEDGLSDTDLAVMTRLGVKKEDFMKTKKASAEKMGSAV
jgi:phage I-like protein